MVDRAGFEPATTRYLGLGMQTGDSTSLNYRPPSRSDVGVDLRIVRESVTPTFEGKVTPALRASGG